MVGLVHIPHKDRINLPWNVLSCAMRVFCRAFCVSDNYQVSGTVSNKSGRISMPSIIGYH